MDNEKQLIDLRNEQEVDHPEEACGIFGIWAPGTTVALHTYFALVSLQHRGQESAGMVLAQDKSLSLHKGQGLVTDVFQNSPLLHEIGQGAIGHVRYTSYKKSPLENSQPLLLQYKMGQLALAHNGNLINAEQLRRDLEARGSIFQSDIDLEVMAHLISRSNFETVETAVTEAAQRVQGGYAMVFLTQDKLLAIRDPNGLRPLCLGKIDQHYVVASESCALDAINAQFIREIRPGEGVIIDDKGLRSFQAAPAGRHSFCAFEFIYFARPDSNFYDHNVHAIRRVLGKKLAEESHVEADLVIGVPDSSISAAIGYAEACDLPYEMGLIKNRYLGRTFIKPSPEARTTAVRMKLNPIEHIVQGKRVILVDDSIVRGTTTKHIIRLLKEVGAKEVHVRITSPPYSFPCPYGIDTATRGELIAANNSIEEIRQTIQADSLHYLKQETLEDIFKKNNIPICSACFDADYPVRLPELTIEKG